LKVIIVMPTKSINSQGIRTEAVGESVAESVPESVALSPVSASRIAVSVCVTQYAGEARTVMGAAESGLGMSTGWIAFQPG
jgi:hypothetical protein